MIGASDPEATKIAYSSGDRGHSCATPRCTAKAGERADPTRTLLDADEYIAATTAKAGPVTPHWRRRWSKRACGRES